MTNNNFYIPKNGQHHNKEASSDPSTKQPGSHQYDSLIPHQNESSSMALINSIRKTINSSIGFLLVGAFPLILMLIYLTISVGMIVIGSMNINDCPAQFYIPIHLIVGGSFHLLVMSIKTISSNKRQQDEQSSPSNNTECFSSLVSLFSFCWFIAGCYWVYGARSLIKFEDTVVDINFCNKTLYYFSFWLITSHFIVLGTAILILCVTSCYLCVVGRR